MKSTNRKPLEFKASPNKPKSSQRENRQKDFLHFLAQGESINDACSLLGVTRSAYEQWRGRHEGFREAVEAAREAHRQDVLCGFHTADAYARVLLDAIQRDDSLPAALRYRAAKTMLTRKGKSDWLPEPIPANAAPLAHYDDEQPESLHAEPASAPESAADRQRR